MTSVRKMVLVPVEKYKSLQLNNCQSVEKTESTLQKDEAPKVTPVTQLQTEVTLPVTADTATTPVQLPDQSTIQPRVEAKEYYVQVPRKIIKQKKKTTLKWITL